LDLAEAVGPSGLVLAVERSPRFTAVIASAAKHRSLAHIQVLETDLMEAKPVLGFDMAWCRWVASFTPSLITLVKWIHDSLRPGGVAVFHEYVDYGSWRFAPPRPRLQDFVAEVMASWRAAGGEPDVALSLIAALRQGGFRLGAVRPLDFTTRPSELTWRWPARFVAINAERLCTLGRVSASWVREVVDELQAAENDLDSVMVTPMVLEIIAVRDQAATTRTAAGFTGGK
jgi:SAM-dependent methyltransferase